ncbi:zf-HC2 domain-containing protein [Paenibacillus sp. TH7-28]
MNCQEAVEWMNRYLDRDLNEEETSLLFEHIQHCQDCAEQFEWLNKLSAQLEDLPKVVPNYSLVDAILPQLDAIDQARREGSVSEMDALPMMTESSPALGRSGKQEREQSSVSRRARFYRYGSLGVAAALILGVFIYQYEPRTVPNAEIALKSASDQSPSADDAGAAGEPEDIARLFISKDGADAGSAGGQSGASDSAQTAPPEEELKSSANSGETGSLPDKGAADAQDSGDSAKGKETPEEEALADATGAPASNGGGGSAQKGTDNTESSAGQLGTSGAANSDDGKTLEPGIVQQGISREADPNQSMMGIAAVVPKAPTTWTSPDGAYEAEVKDGHLYIYKKESDQKKTLVSDHSLGGEWVQGEWSEDSKTFNYETAKDGAVTAHSVEAAAKADASANGASGTSTNGASTNGVSTNGSSTDQP